MENTETVFPAANPDDAVITETRPSTEADRLKAELEAEYLFVVAGEPVEQVCATLVRPLRPMTVLEFTETRGDERLRRFVKIPPSLVQPTFDALYAMSPCGICVNEMAMCPQKRWMVRPNLCIAKGYLTQVPTAVWDSPNDPIIETVAFDQPFDAHLHLIGLGIEKTNLIVHYVLDEVGHTFEDSLALQTGRLVRDLLREREDLERSRDDYKRKYEEHRARLAEAQAPRY